MKSLIKVFFLLSILSTNSTFSQQTVLRVEYLKTSEVVYLVSPRIMSNSHFQHQFQDYKDPSLVRKRYVQLKSRVLETMDEHYRRHCDNDEFLLEQFDVVINQTKSFSCSTNVFVEEYREDLRKLLMRNFFESSKYNFSSTSTSSYIYDFLLYKLLQCTILNQNIPGVEYLTRIISHEKMKNLNSDPLNSWQGWNPLDFAIVLQNSVILKLLEKYFDPAGENRNGHDRVGGYYPLFEGIGDTLDLAIVSGNIEAFQILATKHNDINQENFVGDHYIDVASSLGQHKIVESILNHRDYNTSLDSLDRPLIIAGREGHIEVFKVIWNHLISQDSRFWLLFQHQMSKNFGFDQRVIDFIQKRTAYVEDYLGKSVLFI